MVRVIQELAKRAPPGASSSHAGRAGDAAVWQLQHYPRATQTYGRHVYPVSGSMLRAAARQQHRERQQLLQQQSSPAAERVFREMLGAGSGSGSLVAEQLAADAAQRGAGSDAAAAASAVAPKPWPKAATAASPAGDAAARKSQDAAPREREPLVIKTTTPAAAADVENGPAVGGSSKAMPMIPTTPSDSVANDLAHGARFAIGLERYVAASELAAAARSGVTGTMRAADGYYHDEIDYIRQIDLEEKAVDQAVMRYRAFAHEAVRRGDVASLKPTQRLLMSWFHPLALAVKREQAAVRDGHVSVDRSVYGPRLLELSPEVLAVVAIHETLGQVLHEKTGVPFTRAALSVGRAVQAEINVRRLRQLQAAHRKQQRTVDRSVTRALADASRAPTPRTVSAINAAAKRAELENASWDDRVTAKVGACLLDLLMRSARVGDRDAFQHMYRYNARDRRQVGLVEMDHAVTKLLLSDGRLLRDSILPRYQPMLVPPRPWTSYNRGGYLRPRGLVMRTRGSRRQVEALKHADLSEVLAGLNALGATPWRINRPVLDVVERLWAAGGDVAGLVARADLTMPTLSELEDSSSSSSRCRENGDGDGDDEDAVDDALVLRRAIRATRKTNRERHSLRCDLQYKLDTARDFAHVERFYLPHNLDFRGRAYPVPAMLHHMGSDVCRGLLTFAAPGRPLGERGLFWIKVHVANLCGADKLSFDERVAFCESMMPRILQAAREPTAEHNLAWWAQQEEPFQLLAACFELAACGGGTDPTYVSTLPVHQDGSCNGLQHYAALGRDAVGGEQVNLLRAAVPRDVYSGVAELVRERIATAAREGNATARLLDGRITRKIVKQTVMTSVYGVTLVGAREQVRNRLREVPGFPQQRLWEASYYVARQTLSSLGDIFRGATDTMDWLAECAQLVSQNDSAVHWVTPLGLPVVQPYRKREARLVKTVVQKVLLEEQNDHLPVSKPRQKSAFPPNYIHSLDSSHMLMTAVECRRRGLNFAAVHDSFWSNAAAVDEMNRVLRQRFVKLHSRDLLFELLEYFRLHFPQVQFPAVPERGALDLARVLDSPYFFD